MKITVVAASTRDGAESLRVAEYVRDYYQEQGLEADIVDLNRQRLPLYDDTTNGAWETIWWPIHDQLAAAEGFVFVSPEWHGTTGPGLLNMLMYAKQRELAHKPVMLVGVSSGRGGTYPLVDMRLVGYKNRHHVVIPESAIVSKVKETLVDGQFTDEGCQDRLEYGLNVLVKYAEALKSVRDSGVLNFEKFRNGV